MRGPVTVTVAERGTGDILPGSKRGKAKKGASSWWRKVENIKREDEHIN